MSTISVSLPSDGQTIDAADYNVPINTIVAAINGGLDSNNITAGGVVPNSLTSGTGTSWAWQSWTPTWTNLTIGNATVEAKYIQVGKAVFCKLVVVLGSTSSVSGAFTLSVPVTSVTPSNSNGFYGTGYVEDTGTASYPVDVDFSSTSAISFACWGSAGTFVNRTGVTNTAPFTFGNGDKIVATFIYEAA